MQMYHWSFVIKETDKKLQLKNFDYFSPLKISQFEIFCKFWDNLHYYI